MLMNSLYRSVPIYSRHHTFLLPLCFPSAKKMSSRASSSGDRRSPTPKSHIKSLGSPSSESNDYDKQFPPLGASTNKSGKGSPSLGSTNISTPCKSSQFQNQTSGEDALSSQRNTICKDRDQSSTRRPPLEFYVPPGGRSDTSVTDQFTKEEANGPTVKVGVGTSSKRKGDGSNPCKSSQFRSCKDSALSSSQSCVEYKNRDQTHKRSQDSPSEICAPAGRRSKVWRPVLPHEIYGPIDKRNDASITDPFTQEEANRPTAEGGIGTGSKHKRKALRKSIVDLVSNRPFTPRKRWIVRNDGDSSKWKHREDDSYSERNHRDTGFKNRVQTPKRRPFDICSSGYKKKNTRVRDRSIEEEEAGEKVTEQWSIEEEEADEKETEHQTVEVISNKYKVLRPGMVLLKHYLTDEVQVDIVRTCRKLGLKPNGFYQPGYKDGAKLRLQMMCLGRNWDPQTKYSNNNIETDPIPETFSILVEQAIREAQSLIDKESVLPSMSPDICIVNFYTETGRLGLHQDRDESRESIKKGLPIVSFSIGDSAEFLYGEERDVEKAEQVKLESGDVLIFGGEESRMIFHGVKYIIPNSAPMCLLDESKLRRGRLNLTFRQF